MFGVPYHFLVVHFPLVLILLALFYDGRGLYDLGYRLTLGAAGGALIAVLTGLMLSGGRLSQLTVHVGTGVAGSFAIVTLAMLRYSRKARDGDAAAPYPAAWLLLEVLAAFCIAAAAIAGHRAVLGY